VNAPHSSGFDGITNRQ
jgi:hypothetical protein